MWSCGFQRLAVGIFSGSTLWIPSPIEIIASESVSGREESKSNVFGNGSRLDQIHGQGFSKAGLKFVPIPASVECVLESKSRSSVSFESGSKKLFKYAHSVTLRWLRSLFLYMLKSSVKSAFLSADHFLRSRSNQDRDSHGLKDGHSKDLSWLRSLFLICWSLREWVLCWVRIIFLGRRPFSGVPIRPTFPTNKCTLQWINSVISHFPLSQFENWRSFCDGRNEQTLLSKEQSMN
jgi:hypothetical protein